VLQQQLPKQISSITGQLPAGVTQLVDQCCQQRLFTLGLGCQQPADGLQCLLLDELKVVSAAGTWQTK
jgi:hypothetical protein